MQRGRRLGRFHLRHTVFNRLLHLFERAHLDLPYALARNVELGRQVLQRHRIVGETPRLEDAALAIVEHAQRIGQRLVAVIAFLAFSEDALLARAFVDQPILPFAAVAASALGLVDGQGGPPTLHDSHRP